MSSSCTRCARRTASRTSSQPSLGITAAQLAGVLGETGAPLVVDVRLPVEYRAVHLEPSLLLPLNEIARRRQELPPERELVLVCRTGARARLAAAEPTDFRTRVLEGGLAAWLDAGHPVVVGKAHMSLERQVRVAAGALACTGGMLAVAVSPWFGLVPAFVGAGLVYAGITDRCGMAMLLAKLPYNRGSDGVGTCAAPVGASTFAASVAETGGTCAAPSIPRDDDRGDGHP